MVLNDIIIAFFLKNKLQQTCKRLKLGLVRIKPSQTSGKLRKKPFILIGKKTPGSGRASYGNKAYYLYLVLIFWLGRARFYFGYFLGIVGFAISGAEY